MLEFITVGLTLVLVGVTIFYAWSTHRIMNANEAVVKEMQRSSELSVRPFVVPSVEIPADRHGINLFVRNLGRTPATNLRMELDRDFYAFGREDEGSNVRKFNAFTEEIATLSPGQILEFHLGSGPDIYGEVENPRMPLTFAVTMRYSFGEQVINEKYTLDLKPFLNAAIPQSGPERHLKEIGNKLRDIEREIRRATDRLLSSQADRTP